MYTSADRGRLAWQQLRIDLRTVRGLPTRFERDPGFRGTHPVRALRTVPRFFEARGELISRAFDRNNKI
jgi:hypothetical protein